MKKEYTGTEWSENRFARFQVGLILALVFVLYAFNYESKRPVYEVLAVSIEEDFIEQLRSVTVNRPLVKRVVVKTEDLSVEVKDYPLVEQEYEPLALDPASAEVDEGLTDNYVMERASRLPLPQEDRMKVEEVVSSAPLLFAEKMSLFEACLDEHQVYADQLTCTTQEIMKIIRKHLRYPAFAVENGIEGTVVGSFIVDRAGVISDIKVERASGFGLDEAVINVFQKIPAMLPAEQNDRKVSVKMNVPVKFRLAN